MLKKKFYKVVFRELDNLVSCVVGGIDKKIYRVGTKNQVVDEGLVFESLFRAISWDLWRTYMWSLEIWECTVENTKQVKEIYQVYGGTVMTSAEGMPPPKGTRRAYGIKLTRRIK